MTLPNMSSLTLNHASIETTCEGVGIDDEDPALKKWKLLAKSLPYATEPLPKMMEMLDFIILRIAQCVEAQDYDVGLVQWDSMLT
jgi:proteasome activator subunit 4